MANVHKVTNWVSLDTLEILKAEGAIHPAFNTDYNKELTKDFPIGSQFDVKLPYRAVVRSGEAMDTQDLIRKFTTVAMEAPFGIDFSYTDFEVALQLDRGEAALRAEFTEPFGQQLASELDSRLANQAYLRIPNIVGVLGTDPTTINTYHLMSQRLAEFGCPAGPKRLYMTPSMASALMNQAVTYFNPQMDVSDMWRQGALGMLSSAKTFQSVRLVQHTTGIVTTAASLTTSGAVAEGATSVLINCTSGDTFKRGERVSFAGCFTVHPETRRRAGSALANQAVFIVQQDVTATTTTCTLQLDRPFYGPGGPYQNVDALPATTVLMTRWPGTTITDGASVTGTVGFCLHRNALALVGAKLKNPKNVEYQQAHDLNGTGLQVSIVSQFVIANRSNPTRLDVWAGYGGLYPANAGVCVLGL